ncbi:seven transmembrane MLO family protein [Actinidia rufa]|uniref:Seven transmembrane MLO family protein n=1 Tax=Actinidia rufa TaxID=165716 RepID=A0A7J0HBL2_9ERIC|nr:seven transmembrane MLO family protein [Actinidia rufa]
MAGGSGGRESTRELFMKPFEKIKSELMLLGFISLLLTVTQSLISDICISKSIGATWHPCSESKENETSSNDEEEDHRRKLLAVGGSFRRVLAAAGTDKCAAKA